MPSQASTNTNEVINPPSLNSREMLRRTID
jgi:hypothetical protein